MATNKNNLFIFTFLTIVISIPFLEFFNYNLSPLDGETDLKVNYLTIKRLFLLYIIFILFISFLIILFRKITKLILFDISIIFSFIYWIIFKYNEIKKLFYLDSLDLLSKYDGLISLVITILLIIFFVKFYNNRKTNFINIFICFFFIINFIFLLSSIFVKDEFFLTKKPTDKFEFENINIDNTQRNNIYLFILDSMPPIKVADEILETNSKNFLNELKSINFNYIHNSKSFYGNTAFALGSIFNLKPFYTNEGKLVKEYSELKYPHLAFPSVIRKNNLSNLEHNLNKLGYDIKWIGSHFSNCYGYNRGYCIDEIDNSNILFNYEILSFLKKTAFQPISHHVLKIFDISIEEKILFKSNNGIDNFERFLIQNGRPQKPTFILTHHLISHWPYLVDEYCKYEKNLGRINKIGIKKAFECNKKLIKKITKLISKIDNEAIVILQSDHNWELANLDLKIYGDRKDIFNVIKTNSFCKKYEEYANNNIDTIRLALYCASNTKPEFKDD